MRGIGNVKELYNTMIDCIDLNNSNQKAFATRIQRTISWYERAINNDGDEDAEFIFYWISFNALYEEIWVSENKDKSFETIKREKFLKNIIKLDNNLIHEAIKKLCPEDFIFIMGYRYISWEYWGEVRNRLLKLTDDRKKEMDLKIELDQKWKLKEEQGKADARQFLSKAVDTTPMLLKLFKRLYMIRNQIFHGNATWGTDVNRSQVKKGCRILEVMILLFIEIILTKPKNTQKAADQFGINLSYPPYRHWNKENMEYFKLDTKS